MKKPPTKRVILDKSFLQAENKSGTRLQLLLETGTVFVLTDTLIYEFGTDSKTTQWPATQRKLFLIADHVEAWHHTSKLLQMEIDQQKPIESPVDQEATEGIRRWFRGGRVYVPSDMSAIAAEAYQQREVDSIGGLIETCRSYCHSNRGHAIRARCGGPQAVVLLNHLMAHQEILSRVANVHGVEEDSDLYIRGAKRGLGPEWFAYHHAKETQALICHFLANYGSNQTPGTDFTHTKLDADYVTLLHYADALATNETSGSLSDICRWMHGNSKIIFSTCTLDKAMPTDSDIKEEAYNQWNLHGKGHGQDLDNWFSAKAELLWRNANIIS